jgi:hypothetical protein
MTTRVKLISDAAVLLGEKPISDIDSDARYAVIVGTNLFDTLVADEISSNRWRFAVATATLARLSDVPRNTWSHAFALPSDLLTPIRVVPNHLYEIYGTRLYANAQALDLEYIYNVPISQWPSYFARMVTYALARDMATAVTESPTRGDDMSNRYFVQRQRALYTDAQGRPNVAFADSPFTDVRGGRNRGFVS